MANATGPDIGPPPGMVMAQAAIAALDRDRSGYARVVLESPAFAERAPGGAAPAFKVVIPPPPGAAPVLPALGAKYLPSWPPPAVRPTVRSRTALDCSPGGTAVVFAALGHLGGLWLDGFSPGGRLGFIGFKHGLVPPGDVEHLVAVGDPSAAGAMAALARQVRAGIAVHLVLPRGPALPDWLAAPRASGTSTAADTGGYGFPRIGWAEITELTGAPPARTALWLGGEVRPVRELRAQALRGGLDPARITAIPHWSRGLSRDEFDRELSVRYRRAADRGVDIMDPAVAAEIELG